MTTDVVDSTNVKSLQPLSSFNFNAEHNGIECALCPTAERACDRAWFSAKQIENWSGMSKMTLWRWLERLEKAKRITTVSDMIQWQMSHEQGGSTPTTLYNLNVLNQLAMACIDNEKLNEISSKFSDILSEVETTGSYSVQTQISETDNLMLQMYHCEDPLEFALITKKRDSLVHKIELKRSMTAIGKLGGITKARNVAIQERDAARQALDQKQQELEDVQTLYDEYREHIGEGVKRMSSAQLMRNYPHKFGMFKSAGSLTKFLKQRGVDNELSDVPDKSGYPYTIFDVEKALKVVG